MATLLSSFDCLARDGLRARKAATFRVVHFFNLRGRRRDCAGGANPRDVTQRVISRRQPVHEVQTSVLAKFTEIAQPVVALISCPGGARLARPKLRVDR